MKVGILTEETWSFLNEIYEDLSKHHQTTSFKRTTVQSPVFETRLNRYLGRRDLTAFLEANDVAFFEWASRLLAVTTHMPKHCSIVTRLHRYEMYKWVDRVDWEAVDRIILVSQAKKQEFLSRFPDLASKIAVVYEAVDPDKYHPRPRKFQGDIGTLCHLTPRKRVYELILTFYELVQQRPDLHLHIGGGQHVNYGDYYYALHDLVKKLNLDDKVTFYGNVADTHEWYHKVDIFISNAYSEGLQVAPLEAMASGCYCLVHNWAGADEMLPDRYLYFTDRQLQEKILAYCDLSEIEKQREKEYLRSVVCKKFNIHHTKVQIREIIESVGNQKISSNNSRPVTTSHQQIG
ncbi:MAG: glycosyltransferase family 4 protein [Anaerolineales bacterium]|nr:glycosyltransferase family 4 protein [Anaerolineales bacterium]